MARQISNVNIRKMPIVRFAKELGLQILGRWVFLRSVLGVGEGVGIAATQYRVGYGVKFSFLAPNAFRYDR